MLLRQMSESSWLARNAAVVHGGAASLLAIMAVLMFTSIRDDVITVDEQPHIGAGYSYLVRADYRMNPEHPPLMKDLGAVPLLFIGLKPPWGHPSWGNLDPWGFGGAILYSSGRNPDEVTRAVKIPMMLFTLGLGWAIYWWTSRAFGNGAALIALFLYVFSPTFLAHGRLVTTDVGAAAGLFLGTVCHVRFLKNPTHRNLLLAGLAIGFALLAKFSMLLLVAVAPILTIAWVVAQQPPGKLRLLLRYLVRTGCVVGVALLVVYGVYLHHTWNYPSRAADVFESIPHTPSLSPRALAAWALDRRLLRPWGYYLFGLDKVVSHVQRSNPAFFLGRVDTTSAASYFPILYLVKEPLALHLLTLAALPFAVWRLRRPLLRGEGWLKTHFTQFALLAVLALYWMVSLRSTLHIGVRHLLPTFPFIYILVGSGLAGMATGLRTRAAVWSFRVALGVLLTWQAGAVMRIHPSYLAYFNELAGGPDGGEEWAGDSNLDWGQDLKRLAQFVDERGIQRIHLDYFGSAVTREYLGGKEERIQRCSEPRKGWVAVSAFWYQLSRTRPECDYRRWLRKDRLVTKIGYSILVFRVE
jgi:hypothetical protein